jgi:hypothetical protein
LDRDTVIEALINELTSTVKWIYRWSSRLNSIVAHSYIHVANSHLLFLIEKLYSEDQVS